MRRIAMLVGAVFVALLSLWVALVLAMRGKSAPVLDVVRRFARDVVNPRLLKSAGTPGAYASVIRHEGRTTGRAYETPVQAVPTDDGFAIALPYGSGTDWLKNVLASGSATIVNEGRTYSVDRPEVLPIEAAAADFPPQDQRSHRLFGVEECLRVRRVAAEEAAAL